MDPLLNVGDKSMPADAKLSNDFFALVFTNKVFQAFMSSSNVQGEKKLLKVA